MSVQELDVRRQRSVQDAQRRARVLYPRSRGFQGAYLKGWRARRADQPAGACPYDRKLHGSEGSGTWAFAWRTAWMHGWLEGATA